MNYEYYLLLQLRFHTTILYHRTTIITAVMNMNIYVYIILSFSCLDQFNECHHRAATTTIKLSFISSPRCVALHPSMRSCRHHHFIIYHIGPVDSRFNSAATQLKLVTNKLERREE
eukprot:GHVU01110804.1.p1 GENE.GHVU01110804.1~~GHVU01110804.1.p1  ORF type:complete len:116 (-),score=3.17 GHVU01110804.1:266-613(-)